MCELKHAFTFFSLWGKCGRKNSSVSFFKVESSKRAKSLKENEFTFCHYQLSFEVLYICIWLTGVFYSVPFKTKQLFDYFFWCQYRKSSSRFCIFSSVIFFTVVPLFTFGVSCSCTFPGSKQERVHMCVYHIIFLFLGWDQREVKTL